MKQIDRPPDYVWVSDMELTEQLQAANVRLAELEAENARLRTLLPDADTRQDIREWANEHSNVRAALATTWLDKLEANDAP